MDKVIYDDGVIQLTGTHDVEREYDEAPVGGTPDSIMWSGSYINIHCYRATGFVYHPEQGVKVIGRINPINFSIEIDDEGYFMGDNDKDDAVLTKAVMEKIGAFNYADFDLPTIQLSAGVQ